MKTLGTSPDQTRQVRRKEGQEGSQEGPQGGQEGPHSGDLGVPGTAPSFCHLRGNFPLRKFHSPESCTYISQAELGFPGSGTLSLPLPFLPHKTGEQLPQAAEETSRHRPSSVPSAPGRGEGEIREPWRSSRPHAVGSSPSKE